MSKSKVSKTIKQINERIKAGKAIVVTADEMTDIVRRGGAQKAAEEIDVVTTGTFAPMCSSGAFINFGHTSPRIKSYEVRLNHVPAYAGIAAVDFYVGATKPAEDDPLNKVHPGMFKYGGGHVIHDLVAGKKVTLEVTSYGTDCYPNRKVKKEVSLSDLPDARLLNPRNAYQNYNCAVNMSAKTVYTYMGVLKPNVGNANYSTSGQLSPLFNDPHFMTVGLGSRIFLGGAQGYVIGAGTQHNPHVERGPNGTPLRQAGTLMVTGNLKAMDPKWVLGVSLLGYGCSLAVGLGIPIPVLNEEIARYTGVSDEELFTQLVDYGEDFPKGGAKSQGQVSYAELKSGTIRFNGHDVPTVPLSSYSRALEISNILKSWIENGDFFLSEPQAMLS
jgi:uncharacterized protein (DUF39 family)